MSTLYEYSLAILPILQFLAGKYFSWIMNAIFFLVFTSLSICMAKIYQIPLEALEIGVDVLLVLIPARVIAVVITSLFGWRS